MESTPTIKNPQGPSSCADVDTLIVGFGFASIPLLRLLKERNQKYVIISCGKTIWQRLHDQDKLDFNLVSSMHASYYSQDQVKDSRLQDFFPTAREFYEYHESIFREFKNEVVEDRVVKVDNYTDHSIVQTSSGVCYNTKNLVFATGLGRPQNNSILNWDYSTVQGKTVVINMSGDTANMMLSKLVPNGNKCFMVSNGFIGLEKDYCFDAPSPLGLKGFIPIAGARFGHKYRMDLAQMECHTIGDVFPMFWNTFITLVSGPPGPSGPSSWLANLVWPHQFFVKHPQTYRTETISRNFYHKRKVGLINGPIGIKFHPIDMYKVRYAPDDETLEENVRKGHLLNDLQFFIDEGMVEAWKRNRTTVDRDNKTISIVQEDGSIRTVKYDILVEGGRESPNLPTITYHSEDGESHNFQYRYRETLYGSIPRRLKNIFFTGYTRPISGGAANMNEMQALLIHKLISDPKKKAETDASIEELIQTYNRKYYPDEEIDVNLPTDHLVFYGLYTRDVARFLGLHRPLMATASKNPFKFLSSLRFEFLSPNNSIKYRMVGEYAVEGADRYVRDTYAYNDNQAILLRMIGSYLVDTVLGYQAILMGCYELFQALVSNTSDPDTESFLNPGIVTLTIACGLVWLYGEFLHIVFLSGASLPIVPWLGIKCHFQPLMMVYVALYCNWYWCFAVGAFWASISVLFRQFYLFGWSGRYLFGDCKYKYKHRPFWNEYKAIFHKVYDEKATKKKKV